MLKIAHVLLLYLLINNLEYCSPNQTQLVPNIIGGRDTDIRDFPFFVLLVWTAPKPRIICGGTYIRSVWVLTAAHCTTQRNPVVEIPADEISLRMGMSTLHDGYQERNSVTIRRHWKFPVKEDKGSLKAYHDIALVQIDRKFELNSKVGIARLANAQSKLLDVVVVVGFGTTTGNSADSPHGNLQSVNLKVTRFVGDAIMCYDPDSKGACFGDSGGPMVFARDKTIVGIVSRGQCHGRGVYINVYIYGIWIDQTAYIILRGNILQRLSLYCYLIAFLNVLYACTKEM